MLVSQKIINQEQNRITFILFTLFSKTCFTCLKSYTNDILRENSKKWYFFSFFTLHWAESMVFGGPSISRLINGTSVCATSDFLFCNLFYFIFLSSIFLQVMFATSTTLYTTFIGAVSSLKTKTTTAIIWSAEEKGEVYNLFLLILLKESLTYSYLMPLVQVSLIVWRKNIISIQNFIKCHN